MEMEKNENKSREEEAFGKLTTFQKVKFNKKEIKIF